MGVCNSIVAFSRELDIYPNDSELKEMQDSIGDKFKPIVKLNEGAFGTVILAEEKITKAKVAVKKINAKQVEENFPGCGNDITNEI